MQQMTERQRVGDETSGMSQTGQMVVPSEMKVLMNHIYEYKKGVRRMILFTCNRRFEQQACHRLCRQSIDYVVQPAGKENVNVYFGRRECLDAIRLFVTRPLNELSPEEDFILGAMLGYDICAQCERYCERKGRCANCKHAQ
jgi:hypothetical protein